MFSLPLFPVHKSYTKSFLPSYPHIHSKNSENSLRYIHFTGLYKGKKIETSGTDFETQCKKTSVCSSRLDSSIDNENLSLGQIHLKALCLFALSKSKKNKVSKVACEKLLKNIRNDCPILKEKGLILKEKSVQIKLKMRQIMKEARFQFKHHSDRKEILEGIRFDCSIGLEYGSIFIGKMPGRIFKTTEEKRINQVFNECNMAFWLRKDIKTIFGGNIHVSRLGGCIRSHERFKVELLESAESYVEKLPMKPYKNRDIKRKELMNCIRNIIYQQAFIVDPRGYLENWKNRKQAKKFPDKQAIAFFVNTISFE